jgi:hypothetical protein
VLCDEHGIGGGCEYCGSNFAQLYRINVLYHEASVGKYAPRVVLFNLEAARSALCARRRSASSSVQGTS